MKSLRPRTIIEYLQMLWRRKLLIIVFAAAAMVAAYNAMAPIRNVFEASALVAISTQSNDEASTVDVQIAAVNQNLLSRANLETLVRRYNLYGDKKEMNAAIEMLRRDLKVDTKLRDYYPQFPIAFTITYKNNDPTLAMQVTNDLVSYFNDTNEMVEKGNLDKANELEATIAEIENRLRQIKQEQTAQELSASSLNTIRSQRSSLMAAIIVLSDKELLLNKRITEQKKQISEQESVVKAAPPSSGDAVRGSSAYGILLTQKARLEAQLKDYKTQYTDKLPKVIQTQTEIAEVNRQLAQLEEKSGQAGLSGISPEMRELRGLQRDLANWETDLELNQRDLKRKQQALALLPEVPVSPADIASGGTGNSLVPGGGSKEAGGADEYGLLFNRYSSMTEKRDSLRRIKGSNGNVGTGIFQVVDKAVLPLSPIAPNRLKLMLAACAMAIGVGLMAAFVVEAPRLMMIQDERDVEYLLGVPVIGFIPETLTAPENRRNRKLFLVRALGVLLLAAMLVPVLAILLKKFQVFQILAK